MSPKSNRRRPEDMSRDDVTRLLTEFAALHTGNGADAVGDDNATLSHMSEDPAYLERFVIRSRALNGCCLAASSTPIEMSTHPGAPLRTMLAAPTKPLLSALVELLDPLHECAQCDPHYGFPTAGCAPWDQVHAALCWKAESCPVGEQADEAIAKAKGGA